MVGLRSFQILTVDGFFFWPMCFLSFDLRILITPLVSSSSSYHAAFYSNVCVRPGDLAVIYICVLGILIFFPLFLRLLEEIHYCITVIFKLEQLFLFPNAPRTRLLDQSRLMMNETILFNEPSVLQYIQNLVCCTFMLSTFCLLRKSQNGNYVNKKNHNSLKNKIMNVVIEWNIHISDKHIHWCHSF